jgi:hypothetical protein
LQIKADEVADRGATVRPVMTEFVYKYFTTKFGIASIADSFTAGLALACAKYKSSSLR